MRIVGGLEGEETGSVLRAAAVVVVALIFVAAVALASTLVASYLAQGAPTTVVGIDASPRRNPENTATSLGSIQKCREAPPGDKFAVDVFVDEIPAGEDLAAFSLNLLYDPAVLKVAAKKHNFLIASAPGSVPIDSGDPVPDSDGVLAVAVEEPAAPEAGPAEGVLGRYTLKVAS